MHAFLLTNTDPIEFAKNENAKVIPFELQKIEDVRNLKKLTKFSFPEKTAILIKNIDLVTNEALNAFLKSLEEPNNNLIYILTTTNLNNVLPTIVSRCKFVKSKSAKKSQITTSFNHKDALNIKDREEAIKFIENMLFTDYEKRNFINMENYLNTIKNLKANGNVSLQMASLIARMNSHGRQI